LVFTSAPGTHVPLVTNKTCESSWKKIKPK
jgi:hypothetical protein